MGEIAEDMLDGSCCELCGQYFEHPNCWKDLSSKEKKSKGRIKASVKTV